MKTKFQTTILLILAVASFQFLMAANPIVGPAFSWISLEHNFGTIEQGTPVTHEFTFTNNGDELLYVTQIKTSCGCTAADYSKDGIAPGEEGFVKVKYNASKAGNFQKTVQVIGNTGDIPVLTIKGTVTTETIN